MPKARDPRSAYATALSLLAARELSEAQVRARLRRRNYEDDEIEPAIARLKVERAIDDRRVAAAIARTETGVKRRGRLRVAQAIGRAGIDRATARNAIRDAFEGLDPDALIRAALARRLRGRTRINDERELARLYRYLVAQGFDSDQIRKALGGLKPRS
jgi:regulatory protein